MIRVLDELREKYMKERKKNWNSKNMYGEKIKTKNEEKIGRCNILKQ